MHQNDNCPNSSRGWYSKNKNESSSLEKYATKNLFGSCCEEKIVT